jgi:hypothetical protein
MKLMHLAGLALPIAALAFVGSGNAGEYGTEDEARAMLDKAVAAIKEDKQAALTRFTNGEVGFRDRDLYPYCGGPDGKFTAHPTLVGHSLRDLEDKTGKAFGEEIYEVAEEGEIAEVTYMWPRPGEEEPVEKTALVTRVADQICAVGYYE